MPLENGGFELGARPWSTSGTFFIGPVERPHHGRMAAVFGVRADGRSPALNVTGAIEQTFSVPSFPANAGLEVYVWTTTTESGTATHDTLAIEVRDATTAAVLESRSLSNRDSSPDYVRITIPLSAYVNRNVRLRFAGVSDGANATIFRIDDVALTALPVPPQPDTIVTGTIVDRVTAAGAGNVRVQAGNAVTFTTSNGVYGMKLATCDPVTLAVTADGYKPKNRPFTPQCHVTNVQNFQLDAETTGFTVSANRDATVTWDGQKPLTADNGLYAFAAVTCKSATLEVRLDGYVTFSEQYQPVCDETTWKQVSLVRKSTHFGGVVTVEGTLVPIALATVDYNGVQAQTDARGRFDFWAVPCVTTAVLTVTAPGYLRSKQQYSPACDADNTKNVALPVEPSSGTYLCGVLTDRRTHRPIAGALLTLGTATAISDANGAYCLSHVSCAFSSISVQATGYPFYYEYVTPLCGRVMTKDFDLLPEGVYGRVQDAVTGDLLPGVTIEWNGRKMITGADGQFALTGCDNAPVVVTKAGYDPQQLVGLTCKIGVSTIFQYVPLKPAAATANVLVESPAGGVVWLDGRVATPTERGYSLWALPCGKTMTLAVSAPLYQAARVLYAPACGTSNVRGQTLKQIRTSLYGVVLQGPNRVSGAQVTWGPFSATTDDHGNFSFTNIECGRIETLTVTKAGYSTWSSAVTATCPGAAGTSVMLTKQ